MFWFDKADSRAVYVDKRRETYTEPNEHLIGGIRTWEINPDTLADFTSLPFPSDTFMHVVFDPPHCLRNGEKSRTSALYGDLRGEWRDMLRRGFAECFRVLRPGGTLVFKWNDLDVPVREVLALTPERPLYGHTSRRGGTTKCGDRAGTHWIAFLKPTKAMEKKEGGK
jgi:SAM-dependent methyltransferase